MLLCCVVLPLTSETVKTLISGHVERKTMQARLPKHCSVILSSSRHRASSVLAGIPRLRSGTTRIPFPSGMAPVYASSLSGGLLNDMKLANFALSAVFISARRSASVEYVPLAD